MNRMTESTDSTRLFSVFRSIFVILAGTTIAWQVSALVFLKRQLHHPVLPCSLLFLVVYIGLRKQPSLQRCCGWLILAGGVFGVVFGPGIRTTGRLTIEEVLFGFYAQFGSTNLALIGSTVMLVLATIWDGFATNTSSPESAAHRQHVKK